MPNQTKLFAVERFDHIVVVTPTADLRELEFQELAHEAREFIDWIDGGHVQHMVMDFSQTDYYGSDALGFFVKLWKRISRNSGSLVFCHVSPHQREILRVTRLDDLWPIVETREQALAQIRQHQNSNSPA